MTRFLVMFMGAAIVYAVFAAHSAPPPGGPGPFSDWYKSLQTPSGGSCCDEADCRPVADVRSFRREDDDGNIEQGYEVLVTPESHGAPAPMWVPVPADRILPRSNPTGRAVACWRPYIGVLCFVRPTEI